MNIRRLRYGWFLVVGAVLILALLYSRAARRIAIGDQFQYIPRESELIIATGGVEHLWTAIDGLFGTVLRGNDMKELRDDLRNAKLPIRNVRDFEKYGLDVRRGILVAIYRPMTDFQFVAVVPVVGKQQALNGLFALDEGQPKPVKTSIAGIEVHRFDDLLIAFPEPEVAVVSGSEDLLRRSLTRRRENLDHAANNDSLYRAIQRVSHEPLFVGSNVFVYWEGRTAPFDERAAVVRLTRNEIRIDAELELRDSTLAALDALRRRSKGGTEWLDQLPPSTLGLAVLQDDHLGQYRNVVAENVLNEISDEWVATIRRWSPGASPPRIQRVVAALTDIEDGLPDVLVGVWGDRQELEALLPIMQRELRRTRDMALLRGALAKYRRERMGAAPPSLLELQDLRMLDVEEDSLFHRYPVEQWTVGEPRYRNEDFENRTYERQFKGHRIRYLAPPLGPNDIAYRPELSKTDAKSLRSDRYRMATVIDRDVLWVATDVRDLETLLTRGDANAKSDPRGVALAPVPAGAKFRLALDLDRFIELSLLSPGSSYEELVQDLPLHDFSALEVDIVPTLDETRLRFSVSLRREKRR